MQVNKNNISQFLTMTNMCFMIPVYQRNYDWKEENCKQLWEDVWDISQNNDLKTHFLGTICSKTTNGHEKTIIDGQQRITTITLLVKAIHDYVDNEEFKKDLDSNFLHNNGYGVSPNHKVKLHLNRRDDAIYNKLLESHTFRDQYDFDTDEIESRIYQNYKFFYKMIGNLSEYQIVNIRAALDRIVIVDLDVENENPQEIFESLNSTGVDLTDVDLLRNYLLMTLEYGTQVRLYNDYWFKIEENVEPDNMVKFFVDYLIYTKKSDSITIRRRRAHINENNLYVAFRDYYRTLSEKYPNSSSADITEKLLKDMYECSTFYKKLVFKNNIDMNSLGPMDRIIYSILYINKSESSRPVLLYIIKKYLTDRITEKQTLEMLNACLSMVFRAKVTSMTGISYQFAGNMLLRLPEDDFSEIIDQFWKAITSGSGKFAFPTDSKFKESLTTRNIYETLRSNGMKYLLYCIEQSSPYAKGLPRYDDVNISVEHIMPKTLSEEWKEILGEDVNRYEDFLNKLGNLTLTSNNSEMSNNTFTEKLDWYKGSSFPLTRSLENYDKWSITQIVIRGKSLAEKCIEIWSFPEKYQSKSDIEQMGKRRPPFKFSMIGLDKGDEVVYIHNSSKVATIFDDGHVEYQGEVYSLSGLAAYFLGKDNSNGTNGPTYFTYEGVTLDELRNEMEANLSSR